MNIDKKTNTMTLGDIVSVPITIDELDKLYYIVRDNYAGDIIFISILRQVSWDISKNIVVLRIGNYYSNIELSYDGVIPISIEEKVSRNELLHMIYSNEYHRRNKNIG